MNKTLTFRGFLGKRVAAARLGDKHVANAEGQLAMTIRSTDDFPCEDRQKGHDFMVAAGARPFMLQIFQTLWDDYEREIGDRGTAAKKKRRRKNVKASRRANRRR